MSYEDREEIVSAVQETYALTGRALGMAIPNQIREKAIRRDTIERLVEARIDPLVSDAEMLELLRAAYIDLINTVIQIQDELLGINGASYDGPLAQVQLTGSGRRMKIRGFRRALGKAVGAVTGGVKKALTWGNIILGSLGAVPVVGVLADPIREVKESVEAQADDERTTA